MPANTDHLDPGEALAPGQSLLSSNRKYELSYQDDGNLVVYSKGVGGRHPLWASNTSGRASVTCAMQGDGNLVIYDAGAVPLWATGTWNKAGSRLFMQDDGNAVIYESGGAPVWASNTPQSADVPGLKTNATKIVWATLAHGDYSITVTNQFLPKHKIPWNRYSVFPPWHTWGEFDSSDVFTATFVCDPYCDFWFELSSGDAVSITGHLEGCFPGAEVPFG